MRKFIRALIVEMKLRYGPMKEKDSAQIVMLSFTIKTFKKVMK